MVCLTLVFLFVGGRGDNKGGDDNKSCLFPENKERGGGGDPCEGFPLGVGSGVILNLTPSTKK